jgi:hypothetical protein
MSIHAGHDLAEKLLKALGISNLPVEKIVIVADVNDAVRIYIKGFPPSGTMGDIIELVVSKGAKLVADVQVADDCTVKVVPLP